MAIITEDYVSFETAKLLKEKGFDERCNSYFISDNEIALISNRRDFNNHGVYLSAPTLQMAMKWLREVRNRYIEICTDKAHNFKDIVFRPAIYDKELDCLWESDNFSTYEQAVEAAIKHCLENLI